MDEIELKKRTKPFGLRVMKLVDLLPANKLESLLDEANQLTAIMVASRKSAQTALLANKKKKPK